MLQALLEIRFTHPIGFEHERDPDDPVPGLPESTAYLRALLAAMP